MSRCLLISCTRTARCLHSSGFTPHTMDEMLRIWSGPDLQVMHAIYDKTYTMDTMRTSQA